MNFIILFRDHLTNFVISTPKSFAEFCNISTDFAIFFHDCLTNFVTFLRPFDEFCDFPPRLFDIFCDSFPETIWRIFSWYFDKINFFSRCNLAKFTIFFAINWQNLHFCYSLQKLVIDWLTNFVIYFSRQFLDFFLDTIWGMSQFLSRDHLTNFVISFKYL